MQADIKYPAIGIELSNLMLYLVKAPSLQTQLFLLSNHPTGADSKLFFLNILIIACPFFINSNLRLCSTFANLEINKP
jgi:hypothetical protein